MSSYNWPVIIGALRDVVHYLRNSPSLLDLDPAKDRQSFVRACAAREAVGSTMSTAWHCFTIDPRCDDGIGVEEDQVADTLYLCHQEQEFLQGAAMDLWTEFRALWSQLSSTAVPRYNDEQIARLERAINTVASMTVDGEASSLELAEDGSGNYRRKHNRLKPSQQKAYNQYKAAIEREPRLAEATDKEVYEYVEANLLDDGETLRKVDTWKSYVQKARSAEGKRKNQPRVGRTGRSIARAKDL